MKPDLRLNQYTAFCNRAEIIHSANICLAELNMDELSIGILFHRTAPGFELRVVQPKLMPHRIILPESVRLPDPSLVQAFMEHAVSLLNLDLFPDAPFVVTTHCDDTPNVVPLIQAFGVKPTPYYDGEQYVSTKFRL